MRVAAIGCIVFGFAAIWCGAARAGTYDVWGCRLPDGKPAPVNGWLGTWQGAWQSCASGGPMETQLDTAADVGYYVEDGWLFRAPADTTIDNLTVRRAVAVSGDRQSTCIACSRVGRRGRRLRPTRRNASRVSTPARDLET